MNPKSIPKQHKSMVKVWREEKIEERELRQHLSVQNPGRMGELQIQVRKLAHIIEEIQG